MWFERTVAYTFAYMVWQNSSIYVEITVAYTFVYILHCMIVYSHFSFQCFRSSCNQNSDFIVCVQTLVLQSPHRLCFSPWISKAHGKVSARVFSSSHVQTSSEAFLFVIYLQGGTAGLVAAKHGSLSKKEIARVVFCTLISPVTWRDF